VTTPGPITLSSSSPEVTFGGSASCSAVTTTKAICTATDNSFRLSMTISQRQPAGALPVKATDAAGRSVEFTNSANGPLQVVAGNPLTLGKLSVLGKFWAGETGVLSLTAINMGASATPRYPITVALPESFRGITIVTDRGKLICLPVRSSNCLLPSLNPGQKVTLLIFVAVPRDAEPGRATVSINGTSRSVDFQVHRPGWWRSDAESFATDQLVPDPLSGIIAGSGSTDPAQAEASLSGELGVPDPAAEPPLGSVDHPAVPATSPAPQVDEPAAPDAADQTPTSTPGPDPIDGTDPSAGPAATTEQTTAAAPGPDPGASTTAAGAAQPAPSQQTTAAVLPAPVPMTAAPPPTTAPSTTAPPGTTAAPEISASPATSPNPEPAVLTPSNIELARPTGDGSGTVTLQVTNTGGERSTEQTIRMTLPAGVTATAVTVNGSVVGSGLSCTLPAIDPGSSVSVVIQLAISTDARDGAAEVSIDGSAVQQWLSTR